MSVKNIIKIIKLLYNKKGCIIIYKVSYGAVASRFGNFTNNDINKYTKNFNNN